MLGGWDGKKDLGDFWVFDLPSRTWTCISEDTSRYLTNSPHSFGFLEQQSHVLQADSSKLFFPHFSLRDGGPSCRSCHKMCLDTKRKKLYLIGRYVDVVREAAEASAHVGTFSL